MATDMKVLSETCNALQTETDRLVSFSNFSKSTFVSFEILQIFIVFVFKINLPCLYCSCLPYLVSRTDSELVFQVSSQKSTGAQGIKLSNLTD